MVTEKDDKKWVIGTPNNLVAQAITRVLRNQWYIRDQLCHRVYSNSEEGHYWSRIGAYLEMFPPYWITAMFYMTSKLLRTKR